MPKYPFGLGLMTLAVGCASGSDGTTLTSPPQTPTPIATESQKKSANSARNESTEATAANSKSKSADSSRDPSSEDPQQQAIALPSTCATEKDCVPPKEFAAAACRDRYPSMAIAMFEKHTPWQRLFLKAATLEAVNAYGDRSVSVPLVFGEEVLVLRGIAQPKPGNFQISSSDIDILRWDGTCATVAREMFSTTRMPALAQATIPWRYLEDAVQKALLTSKHVALAYEKHRSNCKGSRATSMNAQCEKAMTKLSEAIGFAVRGGLTLPVPEKLPTWVSLDPSKTKGSVAMTKDESQF